MTFKTIDLVYQEIAEEDLKSVIGGKSKKKSHWWTPCVQFAQGFLDSF
ncbi:hypothetical protein [Pediococcus claussenii]|uniref:Uncharacterized protein n=1 Tax=Pediococcus claussenii (strain ATCC BAA-344 / DSM 14800 / JCM 18046 / KCTC 3811 / LMG 21948 / P06) TaxID=701521 RepID=G8PB37_PEDCP|nr:hypothetical protein [Pediococcus claussenii]AEV94666.1 hypothetical protein PECL_355 [Pediococcus claussenii ATCC BAA-344]